MTFYLRDLTLNPRRDLPETNVLIPSVRQLRGLYNLAANVGNILVCQLEFRLVLPSPLVRLSLQHFLVCFVQLALRIQLHSFGSQAAENGEGLHGLTAPGTDLTQLFGNQHRTAVIADRVIPAHQNEPCRNVFCREIFGRFLQKFSDVPPSLSVDLGIGVAHSFLVPDAVVLHDRAVRSGQRLQLIFENISAVRL